MDDRKWNESSTKIPAGLQQVGEEGRIYRPAFLGRDSLRAVPFFSVLLEFKMWLRSADEDENIKMRLAKLSRIRTLKETQL